MPSLRYFVSLALIAGLVVPSALTAQDAAPVTPSPSPLDDLILRVEYDLSDLRYAEAIRRGQELFGFAQSFTPAQEVRLRSALAAAFYPEEPEFQRPDSAVAQFVSLLRAVPDAAIPIEMRWSGLDSLFTVAAARTYAARIEPGAPQVLVGESGRGTVSVIASRPSRFRLRLTPAAGGPSRLHDSTSTADRRATLRFQALAGRNVLLAPGTYDMAVVAIDPSTGDSVVVRRSVRVEGTALALLPAPVFDESAIRPEQKRPSWIKTIALSTATAALTYVGGGVYLVMAGEEDDEDMTLGVSAVSVLVGGLTGLVVHRTRTIPGAAAANADLRARHRRDVDAADVENRARLATYQVTVQH